MKTKTDIHILREDGTYSEIFCSRTAHFRISEVLEKKLTKILPSKTILKTDAIWNK